MASNNRNNKSNKKKKSWFETLCTMDEPIGREDEKKKRSNGQGNRTRVRNQANAPYGRDEEIPPFDDDASVPVEDHLFDDEAEDRPAKRKPSAQKTSSSQKGGRPSGSSTSNRGSSSSGGRSKSGSKGQSNVRKNEKPLPADVVYRAQPYVVLFLGALLAIMLLLSLILGKGSFDFTAQTHPFRWVGFHLEKLLFGLFGYGAYLMPLFMIYLSAIHIRDGRSYRSGGRGVVAMAEIILLPAIIHTCMIHAGAAEGKLNVFAIRDLYTLGASKTGGGVIGGLLGTLASRGLGVIATTIIGVVLMLAGLMLIFGITPSNIKQWYAASREARANYAARARQEKEKRAKETAALPQPARRKAKAEEEEDDVALLPPAKTKRDKMREDALKEAERSDRKEGKRRSVRREDVQNEEEYIDPMNALLTGNTKRRRGASAENEQEPPVQNEWALEPAYPDNESVKASPIEYVSELTREQIDEMERSYEDAHRPVAPIVPAAYESEEGDESEPFVEYPERVELDVDDAPLPEESVDPEETQDYQGGFDYSMESAEGDESADVGDEEVQTIGGVAVKVEKLSEEERNRGKLIAEEEPEPEPRPYTYPRVDLLNEPKPHNALKDQEIRAKMQKLNATLTNFKVRVDGISYVCGPAVTRYEVRPAPGVRVRSIANLADDIAMSLAAKSIRIEAPIPGKEAVGIEVPNTTRETVFLRRLIDSEEFRTRPSKLTACLGEDVAGNPILFDIVKMPHLLVAGTTGSGKSVCINDFIMSLVYKSTPKEVKIILIDPKQVEFTVYKDLPHLMAPIVCDPKRAAAVLNLAVLEMEKRFQMIRDVQARNIEGYNAATENDRYEHPYMPHIVIIIDELADLMMQAKDEVETSIVRLAQKARAAGMHLIIGTQRPSVDVITGLIKANVPSRIACTVVSQVDSRTILDVAGAEKLLGMGDMLYAPVGSPKPLRVQGAFVSDGEVERIVEFIKRNNDPVRYDQEFMDNIDREAAMIGTKRQPGGMDEDDGEESADGMDPKFYEALKIAVDHKRISTSLLQRMLSIGYGRAAKIIDQMERMGFVGPAVGNKPREIRITEQGYAELIMNKDQ